MGYGNDGYVKLWATIWSTLGTIVLAAVIAGGMMGCPKYNVWQQGLAGEAKLERATKERKEIHTNVTTGDINNMSEEYLDSFLAQP